MRRQPAFHSPQFRRGVLPQIDPFLELWWRPWCVLDPGDTVGGYCRAQHTQAVRDEVRRLHRQIQLRQERDQALVIA
jgi:hypothetical protein